MNKIKNKVIRFACPECDYITRKYTNPLKAEVMQLRHIVELHSDLELESVSDVIYHKNRLRV